VVVIVAVKSTRGTGLKRAALRVVRHTFAVAVAVVVVVVVVVAVAVASVHHGHSPTLIGLGLLGLTAHPRGISVLVGGGARS
jgi:hypothetical protein